MLKKLSGEFLVYGLGNFAIKLLAFFVFPIYAHVFTLEEFGLMSLVVTLAALIAVFLEGGIFSSLIRYYSESDEKQRYTLISTAIWILIIWAVFLTGILLLVLYPFKDQIAERYDILWVYILMALIGNVPKQVLLFCMTVFRIKFLASKYVLILIADNLLGVILGLLFVLYFKQGLLGFFAGNLLGGLISLPLALGMVRKYVKFTFDGAFAKKIINYGYPLIFMGLAYWMFGSMDRWMLSELSNNKEVGLYSIAFKIAMIISFLGTAFSQTWSPASMKLHAEDPEHTSIFSKALSNWLLIMTVLGVLVSTFGLEILRILTPPSYWEASRILAFVVMGSVLGGIQCITVTGIYISQKTKFVSYAAWVAAIVNLLLNYYLIPILGAQGAALATLASFVTLNSLYLYWSQKLYPIPLQKSKLAFSLIIIFITLMFVYYVSELEWSLWIFGLKTSFVVLVILSAFVFKIVNLNYLRGIFKWLKY